MEHEPGGPDETGFAVPVPPGFEGTALVHFDDADLDDADLHDVADGPSDAVVISVEDVVLDDLVVPDVSLAVDGADLDQAPVRALEEDESELDIDGSLLDSIEQELADVERALALLDDGTYGQCEHCRGTIDADVLARTPAARFCAEHLPLTLR